MAVEHPSASTPSEAFVTLLTESQNRIYGYVYSLVGDHSVAADVMQETNLVLWRKVDEFQSEKPFLPWAFGIARFQVLSHLRDKSRDRLLLSPEVVELVSQEAERQSDHFSNTQQALRNCLSNLCEEHRSLIEARYTNGTPINEIAKSMERTTEAVKVMLYRVRKQLADCVRHRLMVEG